MQSTLHTLIILGIVVLINEVVQYRLKNTGPKRSFRLLSFEVLFIYICPGIGIATTNDKCGEHPFQNDSAPTAYTLWIVFLIAYSVSKYYKKQLPPLALLIVSAAIIIGTLFCLALCIHFSPFFLAVLYPGVNLLYLSPFFCLAYLIKENIQLNKYLKEQLINDNLKGSQELQLFYGFLKKNRLGVIVILTMPLVTIIQSILFLCGQKPASIISQFTESCGYLLSSYQHCSCGGDHYLCSIAANGTNSLVKPSRFGIRQGEKIVVNRQLLIANAFENWMEDHCPAIHRVVRKTYDNCNIPVNKWSKHKRFANLLYILMKPLEWLFLLWLYLFDKNPEDRIAQQYFPKEMLNNYIKNKI